MFSGASSATLRPDTPTDHAGHLNPFNKYSQIIEQQGEQQIK